MNFFFFYLTNYECKQHIINILLTLIIKFNIENPKATKCITPLV